MSIVKHRNSQRVSRALAERAARVSSVLLGIFILLLTGAVGTAQAQAYREKVLYSFAGGSDGVSPVGSVVRDSAGNWYGTTNTGGAESAGTVFKVSATGQETLLYTFTGGADGYLPYAGVLLDKSGELYGTTALGGAFNAGTLFKVNSTTGQETVLHSFVAGSATDGALPYAGVIEDGKGNLYGTTLEGGDLSCEAGEGCGVIFRWDTSASRETILYTFTGGTDGERPEASLIRDAQGNLYGTTSAGGPANDGTVFELNAATHKESVLYSFAGGSDGKRPLASVVRDTAGNLYGTASMGGSALSGTVFKVDTTGKETVLYSFTGGNDGQYPYAGLVLDTLGNLYGSTIFGGTDGLGVIFKLDTSNTETVLLTFKGTNGEYPVAILQAGKNGSFFSTTELGGAHGMGEVFEIMP